MKVLSVGEKIRNFGKPDIQREKKKTEKLDTRAYTERKMKKTKP